MYTGYRDASENLQSSPHLRVEAEGLLPQRWSCEGPEAESRPSQSHCHSNSMGESGPEQQRQSQLHPQSDNKSEKSQVHPSDCSSEVSRTKTAVRQRKDQKPAELTFTPN